MAITAQRFIAGFLLWLAPLFGGCQATTVAPPTTLVEVFFVADTPQGFRLFSELREFDGPENTLSEVVMAQLVSGELQPLDPDYVNLWDSSHRLNSLRVAGSLATLDLDLGTLNVGAEAESRAIDQLVWTLTAINPELETVSLLVDGAPVDSLAGHVDATLPFIRGDTTQILSPVQISSPREGDVLRNPVVVEGQACTFEANVVWEVVSQGVVLERGATTALAACPERSAWSVTLSELDPGTYSVYAWEESAEDGSQAALDTRTFAVR